MEPIRISIIIPTFNRSALIRRALDSLLNQTELPDEIIIVDDASTDDTGGLLTKYVNDYPFIKYFKLSANSGAQYARNHGIAESRGDFLLLLDSDNQLDNHYCETTRRFLETHPTVDVLTNFSHVIYDMGQREGAFKWLTKGNILKDILRGETYVDNSSALIRRHKLAQIGGLDENCVAFQEWETHIRLATICKYACIEEALTIYHWHNDDRISNNKDKEVEGRYYVLKKHRDLWLKQTGKKAYLEQLYETYRLALKYGNVFFRGRIGHEIRSLDPKFLLIRRSRELGSQVKTRILNYVRGIKPVTR